MAYDLVDLIQSCAVNCWHNGEPVIVCRIGHKGALLEAFDVGLELRSEDGEWRWNARTDSAILLPPDYDGTQEVEHFNASTNLSVR